MSNAGVRKSHQTLVDCAGGDSLELHGVVSRPRSLLANASWNIFSTLLSIGVLLLLTPFLVSRLGETQYGIYLILASVSGMLGVMNLGLGEATLRFVAHYYGHQDFMAMNRVFQATLFVYLITALVGGGALALGAPWIMPVFGLSPADMTMAVTLARWTALTFACRLIAGCFGAMPQALQRFDLFAKVTIAESCFRVAGFVTVILLGYGLAGLVLWSLATGIFRLSADAAVAKHLAPKLRPFGLPTRTALHEVFGYGIFAFLTQVVGTVWEHADRMLIGAFVNAQAVTFLAVPKDVAMRGLVISGAAGNILMPRFSSLAHPEQMQRLFARSTSALLCLTIVIFAPCTVAIPDFLSLWISPEFAQRSAFIGQLIAASSMVRGAFHPYEALFRGLGHPKYVLGVTLLSSGTILAANVILIPRFGLAGAGYSYCLSAFWGLAAIAFAWRCLLGLRSLAGLARMILVPLALGSACMVGGFALRYAWPAHVGWLGFISFATVIAASTAVVVLGYDRYTGGRDSVIGLLVERLRPLRLQEEHTI